MASTTERRGMRLATALGLALCLLLAGCAFGSTPSPQQDGLPLAELPWCDRPLISFQDDSTTAQTTITKWDQVKDQLGFTLYLPPRLPTGTCLALAGGSIHDPIYTGHVSMTYIVPQKGPLSFSQAPRRGTASPALTCSASTLDTKTTVCVGVKGGTNITLAARQTEAELRAIFATLQPDVVWVPIRSASPSPGSSPTASPSASPTVK